MGKGKKERILFLGDQITFSLLETYIISTVFNPVTTYSLENILSNHCQSKVYV